MDKLAISTATPWRHRYVVVYLALFFGFALRIGLCRDPSTGYSSLILFGDLFQARRLPQLSQVPLHTLRHSAGYDGEFYAQLAVAGNPFDPGLRQALDAPAYRSQRILLPLAAHGVGLGRPAWIIQVYALSNLFCFIILAGLLARWWFPPTSFNHLIRWVGTLFGAGMVMSVTRSLTDGPALMVLAIGMRFVENKRQILGATILAAAGLVRDTSILSAVTLAPFERPTRRWYGAFLAVFICVAPTLLWAAILSHHYGGSGGVAHNFGMPLVGVAKKLGEIYRHACTTRFDFYTCNESLALIAVATQAGFMLSRFRPDLVWWRLGVTFTVLLLCLAWPVWEGAPTAMSRAVLPLTFAFNVLVPNTRRFWVVLLLGNLSVLSIVDIVRSIPTY